MMARDLLTENVLHVPAAARPERYAHEVAAGRVSVFVVSDGKGLLGLVDPMTALASPRRRFRDLCGPSLAPLLSETPLDAIVAEMVRRETPILPVIDHDGSFLGVVNQARITEVLLDQAEQRVDALRHLISTVIDAGGESLDIPLQMVTDLAAQLTGAPDAALEVFSDAAGIARRYTARPKPSCAPGPPTTPARRRMSDSALSTTLHLRDRTVGWLSVSHPERARPFTTGEEALLTMLAGQAAIAVENARLHAELGMQRQELQHTRAQLLEAEKLSVMGRLLASVAHELNNPLSIITAHGALLETSLLGTPHEHRAAQVRHAAQRCARIVKNYLALARRQPRQYAAVDLNAVAQETLELFAYALRLDDIAVTLNLAEGLPSFVGDPYELQQVIVNLVTNAHHALRQMPGSRKLVLRTALDTAGKEVRLEVADTGPGIAAEIRERLFEPFSTTKPAGAGIGLGLSLCQTLVEAHEGTIEVESEPGSGALFRVRLPLRAADPPVETCRRDEMCPGGAGATILVVDDEPGIPEVLAEILRDDGHVVENANDGATALDRLATKHFGLVLLDLRMPVIDGPTLYRLAAERWPDLAERFVFITGDVFDPGIQAFLLEVPRPVVRKPFSIIEVRQVVRQALRSVSAPSSRLGEFRGVRK